MEVDADHANAWAARRKFCLPIIMPSLLQGKSTAVVSPMLPIFIHVDLGASAGTVGAVSSLYSLTQVLSSPIIGVMLAKVHYRLSASIALGVVICSCICCYASGNLIELIPARSLGALAIIAWDLSRKVWMSVELPKEVRGRVISTMAGLNKFATLVAVGVSGFLAELFSTRSIFLVQGGLTGAALLSILVHSLFAPAEPLSTTRASRPQTQQNGQSSNDVGLRSVLVAHWKTFATAGVFCASLNGCRIVWQIALPLVAHHVGLDKSNVGLLAAFCFAIEGLVNLTFTGRIIDRFGRKVVGLPALLLMAGGFALLSQAGSVHSLAVSGALYALGNGFSGGLVQTIAQDVTPSHAKSQFLGVWKMITTQGGLWMPAIFGAICDSVSLSVAGLTLAFLTALTALGLAVAVPESAPVRSSNEQLLVLNGPLRP